MRRAQFTEVTKLQLGNGLGKRMLLKMSIESVRILRLVALYHNKLKTFFCGGSLISKRYVITGKTVTFE